MSGTYFLVNDTKYDNHHGCLTVVRNLHKAMSVRGWSCIGSLPVSSSVGKLGSILQQIEKADLVIINGEGSIHHDKKNAIRLLEISKVLLDKGCRLVLVNALWQDNSPDKWTSVIGRFEAAYCRDKRSQQELLKIYPQAAYAPDLTFYDYPIYKREGEKFACTDSVLNDWSIRAMSEANKDDELEYLTMYTGKLTHIRGAKDWAKVIKYKLYPFLIKYLGIKFSPRYHALGLARYETAEFVEYMNSFKAICVARYHALCFTVQQQIPFVIVSSNSHKSEALVEEVGLPLDVFSMPASDISQVKERLSVAAEKFPEYQQRVAAFNDNAKIQIDSMFDHITSLV